MDVNGSSFPNPLNFCLKFCGADQLARTASSAARPSGAVNVSDASSIQSPDATSTVRCRAPAGRSNEVTPVYEPW